MMTAPPRAPAQPPDIVLHMGDWVETRGGGNLAHLLGHFMIDFFRDG